MLRSLKLISYDLFQEQQNVPFMVVSKSYNKLIELNTNFTFIFIHYTNRIQCSYYLNIYKPIFSQRKKVYKSVLNSNTLLPTYFFARN